MSDQINIKELSPNAFDVTIYSNTETSHQVTISDNFITEYQIKNLTKKEIIEQSFIFLLQRESNTSILRKFDIEVIANYFPEYKKLFK
ncbi:hypothetical protein VI34_03385 [Methylophilales bacterium MBRSG12]|uniref:Uncharacterized protein n=1 Tax=Methylophilales bacterium MBRS-H7 TaxID=1623450 RepID=A0A0H4J183_9PROT|nr:hypothetical protein UZ34_06940 [Methylophilales bacterium MBRSF5]AKO65775.1 hypothetical protein VI33_03385 [Methylophilales bacterium MBRS-H7]AKO67095.1 hypothetical protein VI34_03385 [Methylophilales bacterium MBRSG12]